jgi:hypothetical protein
VFSPVFDTIPNAPTCRECPIDHWDNGSECELVSDCGVANKDGTCLLCPDLVSDPSSSCPVFVKAPVGYFMDGTSY